MEEKLRKAGRALVARYIAAAETARWWRLSSGNNTRRERRLRRLLRRNLRRLVSLYFALIREGYDAAPALRRRLWGGLGGGGTLGKSRLFPVIVLSSCAAIIAFWSVSSFVRGSTATAADPVVLFKNPSSADLWLCNEGSGDGPGQGEVVFTEEVTNVDSGLGSFEFMIFFSRNVVRVSVEEGPFLSSTGRETQCHKIDFENAVRFGCTSTGSEPGPTGSGVLAYITVSPNPDLRLRPTARNGVVLRLLNDSWQAELSDVTGEPIPIDSVQSATVLVRALEGDFNYDCRVNVFDEQAVSVRYGSFFGLQLYDTFYDVEPAIPDFDIDIKDLQFVYGRDGNQCEEREETPTPTPTSTGTPLTSTPTATGTPPTSTPTSTGTPPTSTPTATGTPPTSTPTSTGTPPTSTPTATGTPPTATPTSATPSATPTSVDHTRTPAPTAGTSTATPTATQSAAPATVTPAPAVTTAPETPAPERTTAPTGRQPGEADELPGAGVGAGSAGQAYLGLLAGAFLVVSGWALIAAGLRRGQTRGEE
ncbi:MAG: hypothetical protein QME71_07730 [Dehalococcoidia bacterium]|nr:hypothetical protein [Dehalococcoidia bacterium]